MRNILNRNFTVPAGGTLEIYATHTLNALELCGSLTTDEDIDMTVQLGYVAGEWGPAETKSFAAPGATFDIPTDTRQVRVVLDNSAGESPATIAIELNRREGR
jgi:hypothetical protein